MKGNKLSKPRQIRTLLFVFGSGIAAACILVLGMLYYYNHQGVYLAKNVLPSPKNISSLHYADSSSRKEKDPVFHAFDRFEFSYFDPAVKLWKHIDVNLDDYAKFYEMIANEKSLLDGGESVGNVFHVGHPASLSINMRERKNFSSQSIPMAFLVVSFEENGNYYRVQLRQQGAGEHWVYFYHPDIYNQVLKLFVIHHEN